MSKSALLLFALLLSSAGLRAQSFQVKPCAAEGGSSWFSSNGGVCELRSTVLPLRGPVRVQDPNGTIQIVGEDRSDVALEAQVQARDSDHDASEALLHQIRIVTEGEIHAEGPQDNGFFHHRSWSVSYRLRVPRRAQVGAHTANGSVSVADVAGAVEAGSVNGRLELRDVRGGVQAQTVNGGVVISLAGNHWHGEGISAKAVNGSLTLLGAPDLSAHLVASTVNGSITIGYPLAGGGEIHHHVDTNLGHGGPTIEMQTVNGGITVRSGGAEHEEE